MTNNSTLLLSLIIYNTLASLHASFVVAAAAAADWCETYLGHFPFSDLDPNEQIEKSSQTKRNQA